MTAFDSNGNVATGYTGTVHFTSTDGQVPPEPACPLNYTFTTGTGGDNGVHTFTATLKTAGSQSITATDTEVPGISGTQSGITTDAAQARDQDCHAAPRRRDRRQTLHRSPPTQ